MQQLEGSFHQEIGLIC